MTRSHIQFAGLVFLSLLAAGLLALMAYLFGRMVSANTPQGTVPTIDAGMFSTCLVTFQTVVGAIRSIWESQERTTLAEGLSNSAPLRSPEAAP